MTVAVKGRFSAKDLTLDLVLTLFAYLYNNTGKFNKGDEWDYLFYRHNKQYQKIQGADREMLNLLEGLQKQEKYRLPVTNLARKIVNINNYSSGQKLSSYFLDGLNKLT